MPAGQLLTLDLATALAAVAGWLGCALCTHTVLGVAGGAHSPVPASRIPGWLPAALFVLALVVTGARTAVVLVLAGRGFWLAETSLTVGVPLLLVSAAAALAAAGPGLWRLRRGADSGIPHRRMLTALYTAGCAAVAGLLAPFSVGYPAAVSAALVLVLLVAGAGVLTWLLLGPAVPGRAVTAAAVLCALAVAVPAGIAWLDSRQGGPVGFAGTAGHHGAGGDRAGTTSVAALRLASDRPADALYTLTAQTGRVTLDNGRTVDTFNYGSVPGPEIRVVQGQLVQVRLKNLDVADGVTIHWHGYPVPAGDDGVAGVSQDAVPPGAEFSYRFEASAAGTYWYHTHQNGGTNIARGLYGALIVTPAGGPAAGPGSPLDLAVPFHTLAGTPLLGTAAGTSAREVRPGTAVRLRLINTDQVPQHFSLTGTAFTVTAVDGQDLSGPQPATGKILRIPAGGRYDVVFTMPAAPVGLAAASASAAALVFTPPGTAAGRLPFTDGEELDLFGYGTPAAVPGMQGPFSHSALMVLARQLRFLDGVPVLAHTVNGAVYPRVDPIVVRTGELVKITVVNRSTDTHPVHPHGHHVLVLSRNGISPSGSPLWLDTFDVQPGEVWDVALRADNPGIWMDHCHNLEHAAAGMMMHLAYEGTGTPFRHGGASHNRPE